MTLQILHNFLHFLQSQVCLEVILNNLKNLVVKEVHGSGGYGMLIGPKSTKKKIAFFKKKILFKLSN